MTVAVKASFLLKGNLAHGGRAAATDAVAVVAVQSERGGAEVGFRC